MFQTPLINAVLDWERRLEIEDEKRKSQRYEPYVNYLAKPQGTRKERKSIFAWIFRIGREDRQPADPRYAQQHCQETQPG
jgi:hypothetical protein